MGQFFRVSLAAAVVVIGFAGNACAGGDGNDEASTTGRTPSETGTASKRAIEPEAQARAESMLLTLSDLPDGWRGSPPEDEDEGDEEFRSCVGSDYSGSTIIGEESSDEFSKGENTSVSSAAIVLESGADAQDSLDEFADGMRSPTAEPCFERLIRKGTEGEDYEVGEVDIGELSFSRPANVDEARAWEVAIPLEPTSDDGVRVTAYLDIVQLRKGDVLVAVNTEDVFSPFDSDLRRELVGKVAARMPG